MKFHIRQDEIAEAIAKINRAKSLAPTTDEVLSSLLIEVKRIDDKPFVQFVSTNGGMWSTVSVDTADFLDSELPVSFDVESEGRAHVEGQSFIDMILSYPTGVIINFELEKSDEESLGFLKVESRRLKRGRVKKSGFAVKSIDFFPEDAPEEKREAIEVSASSFVSAVKSVEFASSGDEKFPHLQGCRIEIYGEDDIAACATDRKRICWNDGTGLERKSDEAKMIVNPINSSLVSVVGNLVLSDKVLIEAGPLYTVISQSNQRYVIPNVTNASKFPDWRSIVSGISGSQSAEIKVSKKVLNDFFKSAMATVSSKFGMRFEFDTVGEKKIIMAIDRMETGNILTSYHTEEEPLDDDSISGEAKGGVIVQIDEFKEAVGRISGDSVNIRVKDSNSPLEIFGDEDDGFKYVLSIISPAHREDNEDDDEIEEITDEEKYEMEEVSLEE